LKTLEGSVEGMRHLETLYLDGNDLRDLDETLAFLMPYTQLKDLSKLGDA